MLIENIVNFYKNKYIFITGATGLLGKSVIEKLLRNCGELNCIYVLIRSKRGVNVEDRLKNLLALELFDAIRNTDQELLNKIKVMEGDVMKDNFGLSSNNIEELVKNVSIILHSAATVRFNEPLRLAIDMNVIPVVRLINLAGKMKQLEVLVHISTAYANCDEDIIYERVYKPTIDPYKLIEMVQCLNEKLIDLITPGLIGSKPNTYTFTKQLAESIIKQYQGRLPIVIVRPSIIGASVKEPFPGWIDNFNAATGLIAAISKGLLRSMMGDHRKSANIIPVDTTANLIIAVAWYSAGTYTTSLTNGDVALEELNSIDDRFKKSIERPKAFNSSAVTRIEFLPVFNCTLDNDNITWGKFVEALLPRVQYSPSISCHIFPNFHITKVAWLHDLKWTLSHVFPAALLDLVQLLQGRSPRYIRDVYRLRDAVVRLSYFTMNHWQFINANKSVVWSVMSEIDRKNFNFEMSHIDWVTYIDAYHSGTKKYALKENPTANHRSVSHGKRLRMFYFGLRYSSILFIVLFVIRKMHVFSGVFYRLLKKLIRIVRLMRLV